MKFRNFLSQNKVFLFGLLQLVVTTLTEVLSGDIGTHSTYIIGYSLAVAVLTYFGNNLRGQWASIFSAVGSTAVVFGQLHDSGIALTAAIVSSKLLLPLMAAIVGIFWTSPPKSRDYEHAAPIVEAKLQAAQMDAVKKNT